MDLKKANLITSSFRLDGNKYTPACSNDWTYKFISSYNSDDRIYFSSESLDISICVRMSIQSFFEKFIFTGKLKIELNKIIGSFSFSKYNIYLGDEFNNAVDMISESLEDPIANNDLIEYGLYMDNKGETFLYLGNFEYGYFNGDSKSNSLIFNTKKRYIIKYNISADNLNPFGWGAKLIGKTGKRKFITFLGKLKTKEKEIFYKAFFYYIINGSLFLRKNANKVIEVIDENSFYSSIIKCKDGKYFYYTDEMEYRSYSKINKVNYFDYDSFISDSTKYITKSLDNYLLEEISRDKKITDKTIKFLFLYE